jgi:hypothetical protein
MKTHINDAIDTVAGEGDIESILRVLLDNWHRLVGGKGSVCPCVCARARLRRDIVQRERHTLTHSRSGARALSLTLVFTRPNIHIGLSMEFAPGGALHGTRRRWRRES